MAVLAPCSAHAWGFEGHQIVAEIARALMTPAALSKVDALLASDVSNTLTAHDMASEATWADAYRGAGHRETAEWHFADIELDHPDVKSACFGFPPANGAASSGPAQDCIINKLSEFEAELASPATPPAERLLALKFVLHFVGDIHQPLHASDNHDRGGNCVSLALGGPRTQNLHSYWDTGVIQNTLGSDPVAVSKTLVASITPAEVKAWSAGTPTEWADESFKVARSSVYTIGSRAGCGSQGAIPLPRGYADSAKQAVGLQLEKAGVRLAYVLNKTVGK
jgi:hypothetical protein